MIFTMKRIGIHNDPLQSAPSHLAWKWPLNLNTQKFCPSSPRVSLVGNPLVYWTNLLFLALFTVIFLVKAFHSSRDSQTPPSPLLAGAGKMFLAYLLHYLPFFKLDRQLYIHHYYPALYFSCLLSATTIEYICSIIEQKKSYVRVSQFSQSDSQSYYNRYFQTVGLWLFLFSFLALLVSSFLYFSPTVYGMEGNEENFAKLPNSTYHYLHWSEAWDL